MDSSQERLNARILAYMGIVKAEVNRQIESASIDPNLYKEALDYFLDYKAQLQNDIDTILKATQR